MQRSIVLLVAVLATACTSWRTLETPDAQAAVTEIGVNDTVRILTKDGQRYQFRVAAVKDDAVIGSNNERVPIADIHTIQVKRVSAGKTSALVATPFIVVAGLFALLILTW